MYICCQGMASFSDKEASLITEVEQCGFELTYNTSRRFTTGRCAYLPPRAKVDISCKVRDKRTGWSLSSTHNQEPNR